MAAVRPKSRSLGPGWPRTHSARNTSPASTRRRARTMLLVRKSWYFPAMSPASFKRSRSSNMRGSLRNWSLNQLAMVRPRVTAAVRA